MDQSELKELLEKMSNKIDSNTATLVDIESKIDAFGDAYKQNQRNIERLDKRLDTVEDDLGIDPSEDLKVHYSTSELV
jgi:predicted  nucleic acid-binding Zn-ribbon protein